MEAQHQGKGLAMHPLYSSSPYSCCFSNSDFCARPWVLGCWAALRAWVHLEPLQQSPLREARRWKDGLRSLERSTQGPPDRSVQAPPLSTMAHTGPGSESPHTLLQADEAFPNTAQRTSHWDQAAHRNAAALAPRARRNEGRE